MKVAILSDTHGLLRPQVVERLKSADVILHGGDINKPSIVDQLRQYAPLYVVRGNNDKEWAEGLPHHLTVTLGGVTFWGGCGGIRPLPQICAGGKGGPVVAQSRLLRPPALPPGDHHDDGSCGTRDHPSGADRHSPRNFVTQPPSGRLPHRVLPGRAPLQPDAHLPPAPGRRRHPLRRLRLLPGGLLLHRPLHPHGCHRLPVAGP